MSRERRTAARAHSTGTSLTETLIVLTAIALLAGAVLPAVSSSNAGKADAAAAEVADAFRFARQEALRTSVPHGVLPSAGADRIDLFRVDAATNPPTRVFDVYHPVAKKPYVLSPLDGLGRGIAVAGTTLTFAPSCSNPDAVAFDALGHPVCTNPLGNRAETIAVVIQANGASRVVRVAPLTGRVTVE